MLSSLNQRAIIEAPVRVPDGAGGATKSWTTLAVVWTGVAPVASTDSFGPHVLESRVKHKLTLRRLASVMAGMRARIAERTFAVHAVLDEGARSAFMTLLCEELP